MSIHAAPLSAPRLRDILERTSLVEVEGRLVPVEEIPILIDEIDGNEARILPRAQLPGIDPVLLEDVNQAPSVITLDTLIGLHRADEETILAWLASYGITPEELEDPDNHTQNLLRQLYLHLLDAPLREERDQLIQAEAEFITANRVTSGKEAAQREEEEWRNAFEALRIARNQEREEEQKIRSDLEQSVQEANKKVTQAKQARDQLEQPSLWNRFLSNIDQLKSAAQLSFQMAEAELTRAKRNQKYSTMFLEFKKLGERGREDKIQEFEKQSQAASAKADSSVNEQEAAAWKEVASCLEKSSQYFINLIDAFTLGKKEVAREYSKIVDEMQQLAAYHTKIAKTYGREATAADKKELPQFQSTAVIMKGSIDHLKKSATSLEKKAGALLAHDQELAENWGLLALAYQRASNHDIVSAEMFERGDRAAATMLGWGVSRPVNNSISWYIGHAAENLEKSINSLERLRKAAAAGDNKIAPTLRDTVSLYQQWREAAKLLSDSIDSYLEAASAYCTGKEEARQSLKKTGDTFYNAAECLRKAIEADVEGKIEVAVAWRASAKAYQEQAEAILRGEEKVAEHHEKRAEILGIGRYSSGTGAATAYENAGKAEAEGKLEVAAAWRASAKAYEEQARAYQEQADTLLRGEEKVAELHEKRAEALGGKKYGSIDAAKAYEIAANAETEGKSEIALLWRASAQASQEQARAFQKQADAVLRGEKKVAWLHQERAEALGKGRYSSETGAATAYENAANAETEGKSEIALLWRASAQASQEQAEALLRGEEKGAEHHEKRAEALGGGNYSKTGAAYAYEEAAKAEAKGKSEVAAAWRASAEAYKEQAKALLRGEEKLAEHHKKRAEALGRGSSSWRTIGAATAYEIAAKAEAEGKPSVAQQWREAAKLFKDSSDPFLKAAVAEAQGKRGLAQQLREEAEQKVETAKKAVRSLNNRSRFF
jgi:hypothetical protein